MEAAPANEEEPIRVETVDGIRTMLVHVPRLSEVIQAYALVDRSVSISWLEVSFFEANAVASIDRVQGRSGKGMLVANPPEKLPDEKCLMNIQAELERWDEDSIVINEEAVFVGYGTCELARGGVRFSNKTPSENSPE